MKKRINIVELTPGFVNEKIKIQSINIDDIGLISQYGIALYKQLVLIKQYRQENDLIDYLYKRIKSYEDEIRVLGNGLKYIFPEEEISFWNCSFDSPKFFKAFQSTLSGSMRYLLLSGWFCCVVASASLAGCCVCGCSVCVPCCCSFFASCFAISGDTR